MDDLINADADGIIADVDELHVQNVANRFIEIPNRSEPFISNVSEFSPAELKEILKNLKAGRGRVIRTGHVAIETPQDAARARVIDRFNSAALKIATGLSEDDKSIGRVRTAVLIVLAGITVMSGVSLLVSVLGGLTEGAIASAAAVLASLIISMIVNPLQTVERDMVFRRWSDSIVGSFLVQTGSYEADFPRLLATSKQASEQFAILAASYTALVNKNTDALTSLGSGAPKAEEEAELTAVTVTNPGAQSGTVGVALAKPFAIAATGPGTLAYEFTDLPTGLTPDNATGEVSGTPAAVEAKTVVVTVTSDELADAPSTITFKWDIAKAT